MRTAVFSFAAGSLCLQWAGPAMALGAATIDEFRCSLPASASGLRANLVTNGRTHQVATPSGGTTLQCHFEIPPSLTPDQTVRVHGFKCLTFRGTTYHSQSVATPGGQAHLRCQIRP
jgi:hypothetical protein